MNLQVVEVSVGLIILCLQVIGSSSTRGRIVYGRWKQGLYVNKRALAVDIGWAIGESAKSALIATAILFGTKRWQYNYTVAAVLIFGISDMALAMIYGEVKKKKQV